MGKRKYVVAEAIEGDIFLVEASALIVPVCADAEMLGRTSSSIIAAYGGVFVHELAARALEEPLLDGDTVWVPSPESLECPFGGVLFVVDDRKRLPHEVVIGALEAASRLPLRSVAMPLFRAEAIADENGPNNKDVLDRMIRGVMTFSATKRKTMRIIKVVVEDPYNAGYLSCMFER